MAYELKQAAELSQRIELTGRERLTVTGVEDVERFDELSVVMHTAAGVLVVYRLRSGLCPEPLNLIRIMPA